LDIRHSLLPRFSHNCWMRPFLKKRWFLLLLVSGGLVLWLRPGWLGWVRFIDPRAAIAPALFFTAWGLPSRSLYQAVRRPAPAIWATFISYGLLPALAWLAGGVLPTEDLGVGLLISASVPCTLASALLWTRFAGGNEAISLLIILFTTCTSWLFTTAWLSLRIGANVQVDSVAMMSGLFLVLVIPVGLGQALRASPTLARTAETHRTLLGVISRLLIFTIMLRAALDTLDRLGRDDNHLGAGELALSAVTAVSVHTLALGFGYFSSRLLRFDRRDAIAVAFSCSQKTLPVALFLFDGYFKDAYPLAVVPMVFYHVGQLVVDTFIADEMGRKGKHPDGSDAVGSA
jgi:solute carrier family 10 (sodium/bile acid cotransporter), member 7